MTIDDATADATGEVPEIGEGRYLYCVVQADEDAPLGTTGIDDEPVSIVTANGIGAVVHACDGIYDTADLGQIRRWLVRHQTVVDEAGEAFGTPIPFQFDTILRGDDEGLREWLREETDTLTQVLSELEAHWEYRVEVVEFDPPDDETLIEQDDRLRELDEQIADSSEGQAFLLEKQFDQRLTELQAARREGLTAELEERLATAAREVHSLERSPSSAVDDVAEGTGADADSDTDDGDGAGTASASSTSSESAESDAESPPPASDGETLSRLTLLAHENDEDAIGSVLDDVAARDGLEVRFTGPWPPYTFAPELGGDGDGEDDQGDTTARL